MQNGFYWYIPFKGEAEVVLVDNEDVYRTGSESTFDFSYMEKDGKFVGPIAQPAAENHPEKE